MPTIDWLVEQELRRLYTENDPRHTQPPPPPERPANLIVGHEQVDDAIRLIEFMIDILQIAYGKYEQGTQRYTLRVTATEILGDFINLLEAKRKDEDPRRKTTGIIVSKQDTDKIYPIIELVEHTFGRYIKRYFELFEREDWRKVRIEFYINAWHLGSMYRHGTMAVATSPWLLGERKPLQGDPFGDTPIGQEV